MKSLRFCIYLITGTFSIALSTVAKADIGALGRITPAGGIVQIMAQPEAVSEVFVKEGDIVEAGAPLLTFSGKEALQRELDLAQLDLSEVNGPSRLAVEMLAIKSEIASIESSSAMSRQNRFSQMDGESLSPSVLEQRAALAKISALNAKVAAKDLERANSELEIKTEKTKKNVESRKARIDASTVRAPKRLTVLKVLAQPGVVSSGPVIQLANLSEINVCAEVFASDVMNVKLGNVASITSTSLPSPIRGKVISISRVVSGRSRVVEVVIRLDESNVAASFLEMEVNVTIGS